jgi:phenylacetate-CoA ligase
MDEIRARFVETLKRTEWMPLPELVRYQAGLAENLARYAADKAPFYAQRLRPVLRDGVFDPRGWSDIPILTRRELQDAVEDIVAIDDPTQPGWVVDSRTSGSTGIPLSVRWTWLAHTSTHAMLERLYRWHGFDPNASLAVIRFLKSNTKAEWPDGLSTGPWTLEGANGSSYFLNNTTPIHRQAEWLNRIRPRYLSTNPSNLHALADEFGAAGRDIGIEAVITVGEILTQETRDLVAASLGAKVIDTYGCQELGKVALECPESGLLHICAENMIVEVLDENDQPVAPGDTGRVVLTGFYNLAMPLIRYAIGDYAETAPGPCSCGRTLPALGRVLGRQRNMFVFADNTRVWPRTAIVTGLGRLLPLKQFKMIQTAVDRVELQYVPADPNHEPDLDAIRAQLRAKLHPTLDVTLNAVPDISYGAGGKFEDFISLVAATSRPAGS